MGKADMLAVLWTLVVSAFCIGADPEAIDLQQWLKDVNDRVIQLSRQMTSAEWIFFTNVTNANKQSATQSGNAFWSYVYEVAGNASSMPVNGSSTSPALSAPLAAWQSINSRVAPGRRKQMAALQLTMLQQFSEAVHETRQQPGVTHDYDESLQAWTSIRDEISKRKVRDTFKSYVNLTSSHSGSDSPDYIALVKEVMTSYRPLQAYVREGLKATYGPHRMPATGHIPAHLVDGPNGVSWFRQYSNLLPYKFARHNFLSSKVSSVQHMMTLVEEFYQSLGFDPLSDNFHDKSVLTLRQDNSTQVCYPSKAWNFRQDDDYRVSGCLDVSHEGMRRAVEMVGDVMREREEEENEELPFVLQEQREDSHDDYVSDAINGALSLAFFSPAQLNSIEILPANSCNDTENEINFLTEAAMDRLSALPWYHVIHQWQTTVVSQQPPSEWNSEWWRLRCTLEGVSAPVSRHTDDFDGGSGTDTLLNVSGKRLFQSAVAQFQILKSLCQVAGFTGNRAMAECNLRGSTTVGQKIRDVFRQGRKLTPQQKLKQLTSQDNLDVSALKEYFEPLTDWLTQRLGSTETSWASACPDPDTGKVLDPKAVQSFLQRHNTEVQKIYINQVQVSWNYDTNITEYNQQLKVSESLKTSQFQKEYAWEAAMFDKDHIANNTEKRMLDRISDIGTAALKDQSKIKRLSEIMAKMTEVYSTAKVCLTEDNCVALDPDLTRLMAQSRNYTQLKSVWKLWRDATGPPLKDMYQEFVKLGNEGVQQLGYADMGEDWRKAYESDTFREELEALLEQLRPLYQQLHTYVRTKLMQYYGKEHFPDTGHIPAHILGNMWAQQWNNVYNIVMPYQNKESVDVTDELISQNWTVERMFRTSEAFYKSLGLSPMPERFWNYSMIKKPEDGRQVVCHASAWNFFNGKDFRIKMCTDITMEDLITIHHEMGHVQYYLQYQDLPVIFQSGANPGFHEAIGDTMALSVSTPAHLQKIGLLKTLEKDDESDINFLLKMALEKIAFLPFGYLIDQWRWSVFAGDTPPDKYNEKWWQLRCKLQGLSPPVDRTENDFDPGAKFHVPDNTPYIRYFVSFVLQFSFYQRLCEAANHTGPLHHCDFFQSKEAGAIFKEMLQKGASEPWQDILEAFNGKRTMDATAILAYFQPLTDWLAEQNAGQPVGWTDRCPYGVTEKIRDEEKAREWLRKLDEEAKAVISESGDAAWAYATNVTDYNQKWQVEEDLKVARWQQEKAAEVERFDWQHFADDSLVRQFRFAANIGTAALKNQTKLKQLREVQSTIEGIYAKAKAPDPKTGQPLNLEPGLTRLLATSRNYDELLQAWKGWRDVTGLLMKDGYEQFVALSNEAVRILGYADTGEYWRSVYESETFEADLETLLEQLSPLYSQLHAYVRRKLVELYGADRFPYSGHIPAHLLGNMWAQSWINMYDLLQPFPNKTAIDVTPELLQQGYTVEKMFTTADEFFQSLGLEPMPKSFWTDSMLERPDDGRDVICHASAWDFSNNKDYRIKMCTDINMDNLVTIHHEMGHIQYYLQYKHQPNLFQSGANPGFHEAIGDTLALSVSTPKHLKTIQLLREVEEDSEAELNFLLSMALEKIAFLPFGYLIDQWRWSVFAGDTPPDKYNEKWWQLRCKYQGVSPPVARSASDFDPGAKYHVPANTPYVRYFVANVLQFQFYKALCNASGHQGPLHNCDFYHSKDAGQLLGSMLKLGSSVPWPEALEKMTGSPNMDVGPILEYFRPLQIWLEAQNANKPVGWNEECPREDLMQAASWLEKYDEDLEKKKSASFFDDWNYTSNITEENSVVSVKGRVELATFQKTKAHDAEMMQWRNLSDVTIRRQFQLLTNIGPSAMEDVNKFEKMQTLQTQLEGIYGAGKVCLDSEDDCVGLEPDLEDILATDRNHDHLLKVWKGWRDVTGPKMKPLYQEFVELSNEGVREIGYADTGEYWRSFYESSTFQEDVKNLLDQLSPLYQQLHAYTRRRLMEVYGRDKFPDSGHIPAHLLGNMWAQEWNNIYDLLQPYPNRTALDVTKAMNDQGYTVKKMFQTAERFFSSLGFEPLPETFWAGSIIEKPPDRDMVCHASAWDFYNAKDFRIKMCSSVNQEDLVTIHHEMGHIQYFMQYRHQPQMFRDGANPGFHEAVGDTIALSVSTPAHLRKIGLLEDGEDNHLDEINFLLNMALEKVAFLPFGYLIDLWRWSVFAGDTSPQQYNEKWWQLRCQYQGISPPIARNMSDFDPGAKYHIPGNTPYIRYFAARVLQFQFQKAMCQASGHTGPLHHCDVFHSMAAGQVLRSMLSKGASQPWPEILEEMTGSRKMDAGALMDYFEPLHIWLQQQNVQERLGWTQQCPDDDHLTRAQTPGLHPTLETTKVDQGQNAHSTPRAGSSSGTSNSGQRVKTAKLTMFSAFILMFWTFSKTLFS